VRRTDAVQQSPIGRAATQEDVLAWVYYEAVAPHGASEAAKLAARLQQHDARAAVGAPQGSGNARQAPAHHHDLRA
jgi:hypothetical protein